MTRLEIEAQVRAIPFWWHSLDLGGVITPGQKSPADLRREWDLMQLPDVSGKSVLDIGAWDGWFSFQCEKHGAHVSALDHFVWTLDTAAMWQYVQDCSKRGETPRPYDTVPGLWQPEALPGKRGFDLAKRALKSDVREIVADFMAVDIDSLGTYDIVLIMGVLYHMRNPLEALGRLFRLTRDFAVIETHAIYVPGGEDLALCEFYEGSELNNDVSNWWGPNEKAVIGMCRAAGFRDVRCLNPHPRLRRGRLGLSRVRPLNAIHYRALFHATK
jgi:tRNA (mo5U34)-methyltransferase